MEKKTKKSKPESVLIPEVRIKTVAHLKGYTIPVMTAKDSALEQRKIHFRIDGAMILPPGCWAKRRREEEEEEEEK